MEVDHIVPREAGGEDTRENLQGLCKPCHSRKTVTEDGGFKQNGTKVTLVCGPPGSGKSSLVKQRARWGDLVVDMDALYAALAQQPQYDKPEALLPFVCTARDAVIERIARPSNVGHAWIIGTMPKVVERDAIRRRLGATVVVLETGTEECMRRIAGDERRAARAELWRGYVENWWSGYERDERDRVIA